MITSKRLLLMCSCAFLISCGEGETQPQEQVNTLSSKDAQRVVTAVDQISSYMAIAGTNEEGTDLEGGFLQYHLIDQVDWLFSSEAQLPEIMFAAAESSTYVALGTLKSSDITDLLYAMPYQPLAHLVDPVIDSVIPCMPWPIGCASDYLINLTDSETTLGDLVDTVSSIPVIGSLFSIDTDALIDNFLGSNETFALLIDYLRADQDENISLKPGITATLDKENHSMLIKGVRFGQQVNVTAEFTPLTLMPAGSIVYDISGTISNDFITADLSEGRGEATYTAFNLSQLMVDMLVTVSDLENVTMDNITGIIIPIIDNFVENSSLDIESSIYLNSNEDFAFSGSLHGTNLLDLTATGGSNLAEISLNSGSFSSPHGDSIYTLDEESGFTFELNDPAVVEVSYGVSAFGLPSATVIARGQASGMEDYVEQFGFANPITEFDADNIISSNIDLMTEVMDMGMDIDAWLTWMTDIDLSPLQAQGDASVVLDDGNSLTMKATGEYFNGQFSATNQDNVSMVIQIGSAGLTQLDIINELSDWNLSSVMPVLSLSVDDTTVASLYWSQQAGRYVLSPANNMPEVGLTALMHGLDTEAIFDLTEETAVRWIQTIMESQATDEIAALLQNFDLSSLPIPPGLFNTGS